MIESHRKRYKNDEIYKTKHEKLMNFIGNQRTYIEIMENRNKSPRNFRNSTKSQRKWMQAMKIHRKSSKIHEQSEKTHQNQRTSIGNQRKFIERL